MAVANGETEGRVIMAPYYCEDGVTIYHADCAVIVPTLEPVDLLLTDPPYGIGEAAGKNKQRGGKVFGRPGSFAPGRDFGSATWDAEVPAPWVLDMVRAKARHQVIFGGNYFALPAARCWLVWDKEINGDFADCELAWTNLDRAVRRLRYRWNGFLQEPGCARDIRQHPTQKPEAVMRWVLSLVPEARTVLDPFMGSGTALVAAKRLGRSAIGIEREERYCEIAAERLRQGALPLEHEEANA